MGALVASLLLIITYIIVKIADSESVGRETIDSSKNKHTEKKEGLDISNILMIVGPFLLLSGFFGVVSNYWTNFDSFTQLGIIYFVIIVINLVALSFKYANNPKFQSNAEILFLIAFLGFGPAIYATFNVFEIGFSKAYFTEIFSVWFLVSLIYGYLLKNHYVSALQYMLISLIALGVILNIAFPGSINLLAILVSLSLSNIVLASVLIFPKIALEQEDIDKTKILLYTIAGFLVIIPQNIGIVTNFLAASGLMAFTISIIAIHLTGLRLLGDEYKTPYLIIFCNLFGLAGGFLVPENPFVAYYFMKIVYLLWLSHEIIEFKKDYTKKVFYVVNSLLLLFAATNSSGASVIELFLFILVLAYLALSVKVYDKGLGMYIWSSIALAVIIKMIVFNFSNLNYLMLVSGAILFIAGAYFSWQRKK